MEHLKFYDSDESCAEELPPSISAPSNGVVAPILVPEPSISDDQQRTVPHIAGNWSSFVYIEISASLGTQGQILLDDIQREASNLHPSVRKNNGVHISLCKTCYLKIFQLEPFMANVARIVNQMPAFRIAFQALSRYSNEELTRSFLSLDVGVGHDKLAALAMQLDDILTPFRQEPYYKSPSFHSSISWNIYDGITASMVDCLNEKFSDRLDSLTLMVTDLKCKMGDRLVNFELR